MAKDLNKAVQLNVNGEDIHEISTGDLIATLRDFSEIRKNCEVLI